MHLDKLTLEITRRCPCRCLHCSSVSAPDSFQQMHYADIERLINEGRELGVKKIILSGGEPFLHPDLPQIVRYIVSHGIETVVYTSGMTFDPSGEVIAVPPQALTEIVAQGCRRLNVSVHAGTPGSHDEFTQTPASWRNATRFLECACSLGLHVHVHCVITKFCVADIDSLASHLDQIGVRTLRLLRLIPQGRASENLERLTLSETEWATIRGYLDAHEQTGCRLKIQLGAHLEGNLGYNPYNCGLDTAKLLVEPDCRVAVCPALKGARELLKSPDAHIVSLAQIVSSAWRRSVTAMRDPTAYGCCPAQALYVSLKSCSLSRIREIEDA